MDSASQRPDSPRESDGVEPVLARRTRPNVCGRGSWFWRGPNASQDGDNIPMRYARAGAAVAEGLTMPTLLPRWRSCPGVSSITRTASDVVVPLRGLF